MNEWSKIKKKSLGEVPQEASENIQAPELAPSDKRITGRTEQLNLKVSREFKKKLKIIAAEESCLTTEIMEKALECYDKQRKIINKEQKEKPQQCKGCFEYFSKENLKKAGGENYCSECYKYAKKEQKENFPEKAVVSGKEKLTNQPPGEQFTNFSDACSFYNEEITNCDKPLFDKKKQLCRSHNKQVWKRFNAFLKGQSVSSTAAWLGTWQESGDWEYFWDLKAEQEKNENKN
ncbi:MAG: hypothetical protein MRERV_22c005 [Mycoplasmataceae bacterium RV_VA103A]|nr:MAG: hypothetical protein MRERV_22c005 [Mycoplasmataceae bacterium RV_VA103A]